MNRFFWNIRHIVPNRYAAKLNLPEKCHLVVPGNHLNLFIVMKITQKRKTSSSRVPFIFFVQNRNDY